MGIDTRAIRRPLRRTVPALALALALAIPAAPGAEAEAVVPVLTVSGEGRVEAAPDMAVVRLGVTRRADSPSAALEDMSAGTRAVLSRLREAGIAERDLQTAELTLGPVWHHDRDRGDREITGYEAANMVTVRVRDLDRLGAVLDAAVAVGAERFDGLQFALADPEAARDEARRRAVADALRKAELYAGAADTPLGPVLRIDEGGAPPPRPQTMRMAEMAMEGVPVAPGELEVSARVTVTFGPAP